MEPQTAEEFLHWFASRLPDDLRPEFLAAGHTIIRGQISAAKEVSILIGGFARVMADVGVSSHLALQTASEFNRKIARQERARRPKLAILGVAAAAIVAACLAITGTNAFNRTPTLEIPSGVIMAISHGQLFVRASDPEATITLRPSSQSGYFAVHIEKEKPAQR